VRLSESSHGEMMVSRQAPRETERCKSATWRIRNPPSHEKCRGATRRGPADCLATHSTDNRLANDIHLTPWWEVICTTCRLSLCSRRRQPVETVPGNVFTVCDIEFGDQVVLPLSISHFSSSYLGFVLKELGSQTGGTGSWNLVPRVGYRFWLFTPWPEFRFGD
jgi:hypothetical protein